MTENKSKLQARIASGDPILIVEVSPPKGADPEPLRASAKRYAGKVHAIGVSDNRNGPCMAALAAAGIIAAEGVEPILHTVTRDRNRLALIANCLGAQALGVPNILCTSGTHQTLGACPSAKNVFDIDSTQLLDAITNLRTGDSAVCQDQFDGVEPFCLGAVAAPFADPMELQVIRMAKKIAAGAQFLITQPVYDLERFRAWWDQVAQRGLQDKAAIMAGIRPLLDAEQAKTYAASRPSPMVPETVLDGLSAAGDAGAQRAAGIEIALETIEQLSALKGMRGFEIYAEGDEDAALEIIERSGIEVS